MANLPELSSSLSYTSPSNISNGSSHYMSSPAGVSRGSDGNDGTESAPSLDIISLNRLSNNLGRLLSVSEFDCTDAEIEVEGSIIGVHRCILAARSAFFFEKFKKKSGVADGGSVSGKPRYSMSDLVPFGHIGCEAFKEFLWYLYTGKLRAPDPEVSTCVDVECAHDACRPAINFIVELMYASFAFQIEELVRLLQRRLLNFVEKAFADDVIPIILVAKSSKQTQLMEPCIRRIARSDLDEITIQKELPPDLSDKIKAKRCSSQSKSEEHVNPPVVSVREKQIQRVLMALDSYDVELVNLLLTESGITLDDANALHYAAGYCDQKVVAEVLDLGPADINLKNSGGYTPLHMAAMRREPAVIMALLRKGAFPSLLTDDNRSAVSICRRLTRLKDYNTRTEKGKDTNKDRICIDILEREMMRRPLTVEQPISPLADNLQMELYEDRVAMARMLFPAEARLAIQIAETASKYQLWAPKGSLGSLQEVDLNETPVMREKRLRAKMDALKKTVELGRRYFPHCSEVLDKLMEEDLSDLYNLEGGALGEQDLKRRRYNEIKEDVRKAFSKDRASNCKAENRFSGLSSSSSSSYPFEGDKRHHRTTKK